jgi:hypothetical protein
MTVDPGQVLTVCIAQCALLGEADGSERSLMTSDMDLIRIKRIKSMRK